MCSFIFDGIAFFRFSPQKFMINAQESDFIIAEQNLPLRSREQISLNRDKQKHLVAVIYQLNY